MSNFESTKAEVKNYIRARNPLIIIDSSERERVERMLREIAEELLTDIYFYTEAKQVCSLRSGVSKDAEGDPLLFVTNTFKKNRSSTFALGDIKRIGDDNVYSRELLNILYLAKETNSTLILATPDPVWSRLVQFGMISILDFPDGNERIRQIENFIGIYKGRYPISWDTDDVRIASALLRGFSEIQIENILATQLICRGTLNKDNLYELTSQKNKLYTAVSSIQSVNVPRDLQVAGLDNLKAWLAEKKAVFFAPEEKLAERDLSTPKGILLAGVPGCGKSLSAKMVAREWDLPLLRFDIGTIYDKWMGESERKVKEALRYIDNVSPCIVWIDEIEKALSVSNMGNDTGKRVMGQFLFWLQESSSRVFLIATANDIAAMPAELFRKGRFSETFFIDLPNRKERRAAIDNFTKRSLHITLDEATAEKLVCMSEGFSYSDIEYAVKEVAQLALRYGQDAVKYDILTEKFDGIVPISKSNPDMIEKIQKWGRERAVAASEKEDGQ